MTTTTLTAPLTLLWTQAKILKWLVVLLILLFALSYGLGTATSDLGMASFFFSLFFFTFLAMISGPILFGAEFTKGAFDYLATRPVSHRMVFGIKIAVITIYCAVCAYLTRIVMGSGAPNLEIVLFPLYLNFAFWCGAATLVTKDTVRGLLYGVVTFVPLGYLLRTTQILLFADPITDVSRRNITWSGLDGLLLNMGVFTPVFVLLSPLLFLAILSIVNRCAFSKQVRVSLVGKISLAVFVVSLLVAKGVLHCTGAAYVSPYVGGYGITAARFEGDSLWLLEEKLGPAILLWSAVPLNGETREPTIQCTLPSPEDSQVSAALLTHNRVMIVWRNNQAGLSTILYDISDPKDPIEIGPIDFRNKFPRGEYMGNNIFKSEVPIGPIENYLKDPTREYYLDLSDTSVCKLPADIQETTRVVSIPTTSPDCYADEKMAFSPPESGFNTIHLIREMSKDVSEVTPIAIPLNLRIQSEIWMLEESWLGLPSFDFPNYSLSFAGDYLIAWFEWGRCAVWDVSEMKNPIYLGDCPIPIYFLPMEKKYPQVEYNSVKGESLFARSEDGALVFPSNHNGILWLEFPTLMKEGEQS